MSLEALKEDFDLLDDWEERYRYVIELGRSLPPISESARTDTNKVRGCASQVWLVTTVAQRGNGLPPVLHFQGDSDAHIVKGLIAILFQLVDGKTPQEVLRTRPIEAFDSLGLREHLTPQRSNGFASMVKRIEDDARLALASV
jgi:cysteine desulfuration protein SufE